MFSYDRIDMRSSTAQLDCAAPPRSSTARFTAQLDRAARPRSSTAQLDRAARPRSSTAQLHFAAPLHSLVKDDSAFWRALTRTKLYFENKCRRLHFGF